LDPLLKVAHAYFYEVALLYGSPTEHHGCADKTEVDAMKLTLSSGLCALLFAGAGLIGGYAQAAGSLADVIRSAVADPARPEGDRNRDVARKPVESLQFAGVQGHTDQFILKFRKPR
jgi:hypothetical protein